MDEAKSLHLWEGLSEVLGAVEAGPVVLVNLGQPRAVVMSVEEYRRLVAKAGKPVPAAALPREAAYVRRAP